MTGMPMPLQNSPSPGSSTRRATLSGRRGPTPDEAARWWHPKGVSSPPREHVTIDPRVGGTYRYLMINDENGAEYPPTGGTYLEVDEPKRLVFTWGKSE